MFTERRHAVSKALILVVVLVVAVIAGYALTSKPNPNAPQEIDLRIIEDNPVLQIDHFYPDTLYLPPNTNITLAVQDGDDETRVFTLASYNQNFTIVSGTTWRVSFNTGPVGNFSFISPITPPSPASDGRKGPCLEGFFYVTQNATLLSTATTGTGAPPTAAAAAAAANGPIGSCAPNPLTVP